jgi:hypothetical protein
LAEWRDNFTIDGGTNLFGQLGEITANLALSGNLSVGNLAPGANAYVQIYVTMSDSFGASGSFAGGTMLTRTTNGFQTNSTSGRLVGAGLSSMQFPFHFGRAVSIVAWAEVLADAEDEATFDTGETDDGDADSDFGDTITWTGISNVPVVGGASVTNYTITSSTGYDYQVGTITGPPVISQVLATPQGLSLTWTDLGPRSYTVETTGTLPAGTWTPAPDLAWPIHTNSAVLALSGQVPAFFRVKVQ